MNIQNNLNDLIIQKKVYLMCKLATLLLLIIGTIFIVVILKEPSMISVIIMEIIFALLVINNDRYVNNFLKKVKKYLLEKSIKQTEIFYWNEHCLLLTENYIFVYEDKNLVVCKYDEIESVKTEEFYTKTSEDYHKKHIYINIILNNEKKIEAQVYDENWGSLCVKEDIVPLLIEKNPNIIIEKSNITPWYSHKRQENK